MLSRNGMLLTQLRNLRFDMPLFGDCGFQLGLAT
ncbi:hypothetical protein GPROT2_01616 [Gammaproteobacteria bacterium]|nr:hypothetical protein GPROT2_01616 [Gammaproteobacteria bacterium]